ncbi:YggT family protein [Alteromonas sp. LMIT006]|uniref:YggT family protein n=1 Tax=Alteromonadaceae TaxID=72275 RepID=UPI0020CA4197|nr:YggT family protein [Alteromonas sp. LMIT006]UTP73692.1 YggT family protein [Alteromonas sp. LMIT006]
MTASHFLVETLFGLYLMVVILRLWLQLVRADFYNPFSQFVVKMTQPVVGPLRRFIPAIGKFDTATFVFALLIACLKIFVIVALVRGLSIDPVSLVIVGFIEVVKEVFNLMFWMLIIRALLSWVSQGQNPIELVIAQLTEPFLRPIRKIIPPIGGLDLSVLVAIIALQFVKLLLSQYIGAF